MIPRGNVHTHTCYCDGAATPEDMARAAFERGCDTLGFSSHAFTPFDRDYCMSPEATREYVQEISRLKKAYAGKLDILLGTEYDLFSQADRSPYDYWIGSVHYLREQGEYLSVDSCEEEMQRAVREYFGGDYYRYAAAYFRLAATAAKNTGASIIGHFDLVAKFNEGNRFFDEEDPRYRKAALEALETAAQADVPFEINTGAMYSGRRSIPYPAPFLLKALQQLGGRVILTSDSHCPQSLCYGFETACALARGAGFQELQILNKNGFQSIKI